MSYLHYFKPGQQLLLKVQNDSKPRERTELMTVYVSSLENDIIIITLANPYGENAATQYPLNDNLTFEITTESMGLGIRAKGSLIEIIDGNRFALKLCTGIEMFQRRLRKRYNCQLGIRFSRAAKTLQTMRGIWEKNLEVLYSPEAPIIYDNFRTCRINISSEGIRFAIKPPAEQGDICLILINLNDGRPPICAIAEIVWTCMQDDESSLTAGMRFINILSADQLRLEHFIATEK
ncbi:MAG: PilZ domain-containing protein [Desulfuromonadales bacterium]|nr:PilZ domain-containing protein [Desulfuromonadales bacterium]